MDLTVVDTLITIGKEAGYFKGKFDVAIEHSELLWYGV